MKFPLSWLKQPLDTKASLDEICTKLTAIGLEVESVVDRSAQLAPFKIAYIVHAAKHPQADRLKVLTVDTGTEKLQVVCGAPNARADMKTVLALPGDIIPQSGETLKKGVIRGVESQGMCCAADELGLSDSESEGILDLPADAPVGASYAAWAGLNDPVIEINLTPNRADCAGVYGIARDLAAAGLGKLRPLAIEPIKGTFKSTIAVSIAASATATACPLFVGREIKNIKNIASPAWLQQTLQAIGLRPISALVDITNFLTFDHARPLHVFDAAKIKGSLWVAPAKGGEEFAALNGKNYTLQSGMTAIGDDMGVLSLAGIMGGTSSGCDDSTTSVFIEAALFDPIRTAETGRILGIHSDARYRFERGVDPAFTIAGIELATKLVLELCGTDQTIVSDLVIAGSVPDSNRTISYDPATCAKLIGVDVPVPEQQKILQDLGFRVEGNPNKLTVTIPSWRPDIEGQADLAEEVIRIKGFDHIPATSLPRSGVVTPLALDMPLQHANAARRALADQGLLEAVTWSFMPSNLAAAFGGTNDHLRLVNPISADLDMMRPSIIGNLLQAAKRNADRGFADVGLFEVGPVFQNPTPEGQMMVAAALRSGQTPRHWQSPQRAVDAYDAKADALAALAACGAPTAALQITTDAPSWYHPGRSGALRLGPTVLAYFGEVHPALLQQVDTTSSIVASEIFFNAIPAARNSGTAKPLLKLDLLQAVTRDFAFVVDRSVTGDKLLKAVRAADKNLIRDAQIFDVYAGNKIAADKKSVALSITLQPKDKTLTDAEIDAICQQVVKAAEKIGAVLRG